MAFTYTLDGNNATITGASPAATGPLVIPATDGAGHNVTAIGDDAFKDNRDITSLTLPEGLLTIGDNAFNSCYEFVGDLTIPDSVTEIGESAFYYCGFTGDLTIGDSVETIGDNAFLNCSRLNGNLTIGNSVETIGNSAFYNCYGFTGVLVIPNSVTTIGKSAFYGCYGLTSVYAAGNAPTAGSNCFVSITAPLYVGSAATGWGATFDALTVYKINYTQSEGKATITGTTPTAVGGLYIPAIVDGYNVTAIGNSAFYGNINITSLTLPEGLLTIGNYAFSSCYGFRGSLVIPNSVTTIGVDAFHQCGFSDNLTIGNSVTSIEAGTFFSCSGFTGDLVIPNSVTTIGQSAFNGCSGFSGDLIIGNSVTEIGGLAFVYSSLTSAWFGGNIPTFGYDAFSSSNIATFYRFSAATGWDSTYESIPVVTIPYTEVSESNVAIGESYGLGETRTGTMKVGHGINGSGILGFL